MSSPLSITPGDPNLQSSLKAFLDTRVRPVTSISIGNVLSIAPSYNNETVAANKTADISSVVITLSSGFNLANDTIAFTPSGQLILASDPTNPPSAQATSTPSIRGPYTCRTSTGDN